MLRVLGWMAVVGMVVAIGCIAGPWGAVAVGGPMLFYCIFA